MSVRSFLDTHLLIYAAADEPIKQARAIREATCAVLLSEDLKTNAVIVGVRVVNPLL